MGSNVTTVNVSDSIYSNHTCAIQAGTVKCTGDNLYGQLGNNSTIKASYNTTFTSIKTLESDVNILKVSKRFSCAIQRGALKCWGDNIAGQLGNKKREVKKEIKNYFLNILRIIKYTWYDLILTA